MQWLLKKLNSMLTEERKWLRLEGLGAHDVKYAHGARMARERIPQLEAAIKILGDYSAVSGKVDAHRGGVGAQAPQPKPKPVELGPPAKAKANQLKLFEAIATIKT